MRHLRSYSTLAVLAIAMMSAPRLTADERTDRERTTRIECLIELLASKNHPPKIRGNARRGEDQTIQFSSDYDMSLQVPVYLAIKELLAEEEAAVDLLVAHQGDERYSFSLNSDADYNITVSQACERIARKKLLAYEPELKLITGLQYGTYPADQQVPFKTWWSKNKERGLAKLQIEAIDEQIKLMATVDGATALPPHPQARRLPLDEFNRHRDANLQTLKAIRQCVEATGAPYRAKTLDEAYSCFFGLPWTGRRHNK